MRVRVYIDGFNLYYGSLKDQAGVKWLDLMALSAALMPNAAIDRVSYFTARVTARPEDPQEATRQQVYLRAIAGDPAVRIIEGQYVFRKKSVHLWDAPHEKVLVRHVEEKGSDVNLAAFLVYDACMGNFDTALVISNDSDLAEAIRLVRDSVSKRVVVANPHPNASKKLKSVATTHKQIYPGVLKRCQLPDPALDVDGKPVHKPPHW